MGEAIPSHTTGQQHDLATRTADFAQNVRTFIRRIPKTIASMSDCRRLARCSGDIGSSYLDADNALTRNTFLGHIRDCNRSARQTKHWLRLLDVNLDDRSKQLHDELMEEADALERIFEAMLRRTGVTRPSPPCTDTHPESH